jgi:3-oxoacyl-[acyl-carrier-protein] synthase II
MKGKRVVITGLAAVTPVGNSIDETWNNLLEGQSGIGKITVFDSSEFPVHIGAEIKNFNIEDHVDKKEAKRMDPFSQLAVACAEMCLKDAGINLENTDRNRFGVIIGSGIGGLIEIEEQHTKAIQK